MYTMNKIRFELLTQGKKVKCERLNGEEQAKRFVCVLYTSKVSFVYYTDLRFILF